MCLVFTIFVTNYFPGRGLNSLCSNPRSICGSALSTMLWSPSHTDCADTHLVVELWALLSSRGSALHAFTVAHMCCQNVLLLHVTVVCRNIALMCDVDRIYGNWMVAMWEEYKIESLRAMCAARETCLRHPRILPIVSCDIAYCQLALCDITSYELIQLLTSILEISNSYWTVQLNPSPNQINDIMILNWLKLGRNCHEYTPYCSWYHSDTIASGCCKLLSIK